jgi:diguanylate cyclase (GGDEF)-like protein/PAS domain S-box-containing protein
MPAKTLNTGPFSDIAVLQRKWNAALRPGLTLPPYEEVMLGSLGRLADNVALLRSADKSLEVLRAGRYIQEWLGDTVWDTPLAALPPDCATALEQAVTSALHNNRPHLGVAHCVRDGLVQTYDVLALPTSSRWGGELIGAYINERKSRYNLLDAIFASTNEGILSLATIRNASGDPCDFQIVHLNDGASRLLQCPPDELRWQRLSAGNHSLCASEVMQRLIGAVVRGRGDSIEIGSGERDLKLGVTVFADMVSVTISDVTELKKREESFRLLFDNNPMPMWVFDAETTGFLGVNDAAVKHYGYDRAKFLRMKLQDIWPRDEWDMHMEAVAQLADVYQSGRNWRHLKADGSEVQVLTFGRRVVFAGREGFLVACVDITERKRAEARVAHMAHHDGLTNLANRVAFQDRLGQALEQAGVTAVLCIDLDLFKNVNDSFGHPTGDRLLTMVAERLRHAVGGGNLAARLGGDEFAVLLTRVGSSNEVSDYAARLIETLSAHYDIDGIEVVIGASVGVALSPGDGASGDELLRNADMALYRAKSEGGGTQRFFEREMDRLAQKRRDVEQDLRRALVNGEFELHYQPLINLAQDRIAGFESLLRWQHPTKGMVSPADFIPVAEDIGLIVGIGEWVLREACAAAVKWPSNVKVAVNLSPVQFRSRNLVSAVVAALAHSGLSPLRLELEITESGFLAETAANLATLHQLRGLGVRISMDDFGTGYSSLSYLRSFPFDKIKIDRSFVSDLAERPDCGAIVRAISGLGRSLNITTTAEGVETAEQLEWLRAEGCNEVQGFLFSSARPAAEIESLLLKFGALASKAA